MRTIETTIYEYNELSEVSKEKAIEQLSDINIEHDWWDYIYEEAEGLGFTIKGFDIDRGGYLTLKRCDSAASVCKQILANHGESCATWQIAKAFLSEIEDLCSKELDNGEDLGESEELQERFEKDLAKEYLAMLTEEFDYLTRKETIEESIIANGYEFTFDGKIVLGK